MSLYLCCEICDAADPHWTIMRTGDVATSWACDAHLSAVCEGLQRYDDPPPSVTELTLKDSRKLRELVALNAALDKIAGETP